MNVEVVHKNKNLDIVKKEIVDFDVYCRKLSQDCVGILSEIENFFEKQKLANEDYMIDDLFYLVRHRLFDVAGAIGRLPNDLIKE